MACFGDVYPISISLVTFPLPNILLSFFIPPHSVPLHRSILKVANIIFIIILQWSFSMRSIIPKLADIDWTIWKFLVAFSTLKVQAEFSLVDSILDKKDSQTVLHALIKSTKIEWFLIEAHVVTLLACKLIHCEQCLLELVSMRRGKVAELMLPFFFWIQISNPWDSLLDLHGKDRLLSVPFFHGLLLMLTCNNLLKVAVKLYSNQMH